MRLSIERMSISNFKGIRDLTLDFAQSETAIFGANGTGKTSIPDAFCWVLYNKDSHGNAPGSDNFREKPLDDAGHEVHNLETTVALDCKLDGKAFNLRRSQAENWVKKRGSLNPVYQGNASTYWINDVETPLKDFKARIAEIAPEEVFRLIGTLAAFNAQEWRKRREQLLALSGGDVDAKLLATDEYRPLADECGQRNIGIDDLRKVLADQRKRTNTELQMIPVRIDEATKALPDLTDREIKDAEYIIQDTTAELERLDGYIAEAKAETAGGGNLTMQIVALVQEAASITRQITAEWTNAKQAIEKRRDDAAKDLLKSAERKSAEDEHMTRIKERLERAESSRNALRASYTSVRAEQFVWQDGERICPTCGQAMPEEKVQAIKAAEQARFEADKKARLAEIAQKGADAAKEVEYLTTQLAEIDAALKQAEEQSETAKAERDSVNHDLLRFPAAPDFDGNEHLTDLKRQIAVLKAKQAETPDEKVAGLLRRKAELQGQIEAKRAVLAKRDAGIETRKRISELEQKQKDIGAALVELEQLISLAEQFVTDRCAALEESINACFPTIRWKLFETQINGGITDVCNCMIPCDTGIVPYESANTAAQINADLEIINVLSKHYDVYIPLFVDGAESVNVLAHTDSQLITLSVSTDSKLQIKEVA